MALLFTMFSMTRGKLCCTILHCGSSVKHRLINNGKIEGERFYEYPFGSSQSILLRFITEVENITYSLCASGPIAFFRFP